jgi:rhomboid protease GluP
MLGVTFVLIAVNVAVYAYTAILSGNFVAIDPAVLATYGQTNALVFQGAFWQLFTSLFVHASIVHIGGNMLFLLIFGLRAEEMFDTEQYLLIYFLSGLAGNLLTLVYRPDMISVGASGAIFGLFGAVTIYMRRSIGQSIIGALMFAFFLLLINIGPEVNILAHLGGLLVGLLIGYLLGTRSQRKPSHPYQITYSYPNRRLGKR